MKILKPIKKKEKKNTLNLSLNENDTRSQLLN